MKRYVFGSFAALSLMLAAAAASYAQSQKVTATIPFDFVVSGKTLPEGAYAVTRNTAGSLKVQSYDSTVTVVALANYAQSSTPREEAVLVFDRIDNRYFLRQIWEPGELSGVEIPQSKMQRELMKRSLASASPRGQQPAGPELVYVAARVN